VSPWPAFVTVGTVGFFGQDHPKTAEVICNLALLYQDVDKPQESERMFRQALEIVQVLLPPHHPRAAFADNSFGALLFEAGRYEEAEEHFGRALEIRRANHGDAHADTIRSLFNLCSIYEATGYVDHVYLLHGHRVRVTTLDLNRPGTILSSAS
jgi:tetratricopeptide (TPR) repeat protein